MKKIKITASKICLYDKNENFLDNLTKQNNIIEYVIYLNQITCISTNAESGTDIRLSCGLVISLLDSIKVVERLIDDAYNQ
jgi:hypothetical protein